MAGKKTRFVIEMRDGSERDIFSVAENANGGLTILMPKTQHSEISTVYNVEHRFSIHESLNSHDGGFEVKETVERSDGSITHNFAYARANVETTMLHIFGHIAERPASLPDSSGKPSKGRVVVMQDFWRGSPFYVVIASKTPFDSRWLAPTGLSVAEAQFKRYRLIVASGIFHALAPTGGGLTASIMSQPSRINGQYQIWIRQPGAPQFPVSPSPKHLPFEVGQMIDDLAASGEESSKALKWNDSGAIISAEEHYKYCDYSRYSRDPSETCIINRPLARAIRLSLHPSDLWNPLVRGPAVSRILPPADTNPDS